MKIYSTRFPHTSVNVNFYVDAVSVFIIYTWLSQSLMTAVLLLVITGTLASLMSRIARANYVFA